MYNFLIGTHDIYLQCMPPLCVSFSQKNANCKITLLSIIIYILHEYDNIDNKPVIVVEIWVRTGYKNSNIHYSVTLVNTLLKLYSRYIITYTLGGKANITCLMCGVENIMFYYPNLYL